MQEGEAPQPMAQINRSCRQSERPRVFGRRIGLTAACVPPQTGVNQPDCGVRSVETVIDDRLVARIGRLGHAAFAYRERMA